MQKTTDNRIIINEEKKYHDNMDDFCEGKDKTEKINGKTENTTETRIIEKKIKETTQERIEENFEQTKEQQKFEEIQHYNNKERLREIRIYVRAQDVNEINKLKITEKIIETLELLKNEGIYIDAAEISGLKEPTLTNEQIKNNIKILKEGGIKIEPNDICLITEQIYTENDIIKAKKLKELVNIYTKSITKVIKYYTMDDVEKFKKMNESGIFYDFSINIIKKLEDEDIEKMKIVQEYGIKIVLNDETLERIRAGKYEKIIELKNLGINIYDALSNIRNLIGSDIDTVIKLKKIGIKISNIENLGNTLGLNDEDIQNIEKLIGIGIQIDENNIQEIKGINLLSTKDIENIQELERIGIKFDAKYIKDMEGITNTNIENIKKLIKMGKKFEAKQIKYLKSIEEEDIETIKKLEKNFGLKIEKEDIVFIIGLKITDTNITNMKRLSELGYKVKIRNIGNIYDITTEDLDKIERIMHLLKRNRIGNGKINEENSMDEKIKNYKGLNDSYIGQLKEFDELGITIYCDNIKIDTTEKDINKIKILNGIGINIDINEIGIIKEIDLTEENIKTIKKFGNNIENLYEIKAIIENKELMENENKNIYKGYNYTNSEIKLHQQYTKGKIIEEIEQYIQEKIDEKKEIGVHEIINKIRSKSIILPQKERIKITGIIYKLIKKNNTIRKYLDFEKGPYKSPKELLCAIRGITNQKIIKEICDDITVKQHGSGLYFFVPEKRSFRIIYDRSLKLTKKSEAWAGINCYYSYINDLSGTLSINNGKDPSDNKKSYEYGTIWHEGQHNRNSYFMPDKLGAYEPIRQTKDEITADLREGKDIDTIKEILTRSEKEGGNYQYDLKGFKRIIHKKNVKKLIKYTKDIISIIDKSKGKLNKDEIISTLSSVKLEGREELHKNMIEIMKAYEKNETKKSKIKEIKEKFVKQIKIRSENNKLIEYLIEWRNFIFPYDEINMDKFWRTGTEKLETVVNKIEKCNSIIEIKYILNNPKYSNISRGPNNRGGIEISAIIDEVSKGKLSKEFIPVEIRAKVINYIK